MRWSVAVVIALLFLSVRALITYARDPFSDELFTVLLARRPFQAILPSLLNDSGPPLYYFVARIPSVDAGRVLSVVFASIPLLVLLLQKRWLPALLLAVHPAAAIFAAAARPYALCGTLIAVGILLMERNRVEAAAAAFVGGAYAHFAAAFFLPTLLFAPLLAGTIAAPPRFSRHSPRERAVRSTALAALAFLPAFVLAVQQPRAATAWISRPTFKGVLNALAFIGDDPGPPLWVMFVACALTVVAAGRSWRFAPLVLLPLGLCVALSVLRPSYFPIRFASLLAFPLVLWIADSLAGWGRTKRVILAGALVAVGFGSILVGAITHLQRPLGDYRQAAIQLRRNAAPNDVIVATGFLYLEVAHQFGEGRVQAFPREQAIHPGWRVPPRRQVDTRSLPPAPFLWIGERTAPELAAIRRERETRLLYQNRRALILHVR